MSREQGVVLIDRSAQQGGALSGHGKTKARQHARIVCEQTIAAALYIAQRVRQQECVAVFEREAWQQPALFTAFVGCAHIWNLSKTEKREVEDGHACARLSASPREAQEGKFGEAVL
jgi:hypothetical protein